MRRLLAQLDGLYMVDTSCDDDLVPFYERFGMMQGNAMARRNYAAQKGREEGEEGKVGADRLSGNNFTP